MADEINSINVYPLNGYGNLKAMASINFKGVLLRGLRILEKDEELWIGMPSKKRGEKWEDIYFFPDPKIRGQIKDILIDKYKIAASA